MVLYSVLATHHPRCRELRLEEPFNIEMLRGVDPDEIHIDRQTFDRVAARYYHLQKGEPRSILGPILASPRFLPHFAPIRNWDFHTSHRNAVPKRSYIPPYWSYDDGLVAFVGGDAFTVGIWDLDTTKMFPVPFQLASKFVRNIRLKDRVLVIEWANDDFMVRSRVERTHFASSFDVKFLAGRWHVACRSQWRISPVGSDFDMRQDRFYSTHSDSHYAMYRWRSSRERAPGYGQLESLTVWDISRPSVIWVSASMGTVDNSAHDDGAFKVASFNIRDLAFYAIQQRGVPALIRLDIRSEVSTIDVTECFYCQSDGSDGLARVRVTSIPFIGHGPCWQRDVEDRYPHYSGAGSMNDSKILTTELDTEWYYHISEANDTPARVSFSLQSNAEFSIGSIIIRAPDSCARLRLPSSFIIGRNGKICGDERFLVGENGAGCLNVLRFDQP